MAKSKKGYINIILEVNKLLQEKRKEKGDFWFCYSDPDYTWGYDLSYSHDIEINLEETSYNLDFRITTFQSRAENIYFYVSLHDYVTCKEYKTGYYYIKNYSGIIGKNELLALNDIIQAGTELTNKIYMEH